MGRAACRADGFATYFLKKTPSGIRANTGNPLKFLRKTMHGRDLPSRLAQNFLRREEFVSALRCIGAIMIAVGTHNGISTWDTSSSLSAAHNELEITSRLVPALLFISPDPHRTQPREMESAMAHSKSAISQYWIFIGGSSKYWGRSGENMGLGYDIFRELSDGNPLWIAQATTLKEASEKLDTLTRTVPAKYFIRDATSTEIVARAGPDTAEETNP